MLHQLRQRLFKGGDGGSAIVHGLDAVKAYDGDILAGYFTQVMDSPYDGRGDDIRHAADGSDLRMPPQVVRQGTVSLCTAVVAFQDIFKIVLQMVLVKRSPVSFYSKTIYAVVYGGGYEGADIFMSLFNQIVHLGVCRLKMIYLHAGIGSVINMQRQHGVDENGGAGQQAELLLADAFKIASDINESGQLMLFEIGRQLLKFFLLILYVIIVVEGQYGVAGVVQSDGEHLLQGTVERIVYPLHHQPDLCRSPAGP